MRLNNVAIDVINFAHPDNVPKLQALVQCANNSDNSHFLDVPMGVAMITDVLITSPILQGDDAVDVQMNDQNPAGGIADPAANRFADYGGINPSMDPELAEAMRVSMLEARQGQEEQAKGDAKPGEVLPAVEEEEEHDE